MAVVIGIDLGTTSLQGVVVDAAGRQLASAEQPYELLTPQPGWSEQDPAAWFQALCMVTRELLAGAGSRELAGIAISGQMHGLVPVDATGEPVHNAILWNDQRTELQAGELRTTIGDAELIRRTGNPAITGFQLPKLLWLRQNEPAAFDRTVRVLLPKDWLSQQLTGNFSSEPSDASGTGVFNISSGDWDEAILTGCGLDRNLFPVVIASHEQAGTVQAAAAKATGLPPGTPVFAGAGDNAAANIGLGLSSRQPGRGSLSLGTSGVVFVPLAGPEPDREGRVHLFSHADSNWCLLGVTLAAGGSLRWFRDRFLGGEGYGELNRLAARSGPGAAGVTFHPYLAGERSPWLDASLRGSFSGLSLASGLADMSRAVLEGVAFSLKDVIGVFRERLQLDELLVTGGGARSPLFLQLVADVLGVELQVVSPAAGAAYGSALLALQGLGFTDSAASAARVKHAQVVTPRQEPLLEAAHQRYIAVREKLHLAQD